MGQQDVIFYADIKRGNDNLVFWMPALDVFGTGIAL